MNALLLLLPFAFASEPAGWPPGVTFVLALLPLCSLAERLGMITEQLAMYTNDSIGGLLNATFGNATEVIIAAFAISKGYLRIVKLTLLGSIVSNLLLVLGSAFIAGGVLHPMQHFNQKGVNVNCGLLILSVISIALPTLLSETSNNPTDARAELALSRFESILLLMGYATFLVFQLVTHKFLYEGDLMAGEPPGKSEPPSRAQSAPGPLPDGSCGSCGCLAAGARLAEESQRQLTQQRPDPLRQRTAEQRGPNSNSNPVSSILQPSLELVSFGMSPRRGGGLSSSPHSNGKAGGGAAGMPPRGGAAALSGGDARIDVAAAAAASAFDRDWDEGERASLMPGAGAVLEFEDDDEEEECVLSLYGALVWLAAVTVVISFLSDIIMNCITEASAQLKVPMPFLTTIIVPIVGNAAEHASALIFAVKNRMEVALGVAVGSSTQVGILVIPFCVVLAWAMGQPLDLNLNEFEALVLFISVLLAVVVLQDGSANYLKGLMLVMTYLFIAAGFWLHKDPELKEAIDNGAKP